MLDFSSFRSSLNGFNRNDVVSYIESLCAEHEKALTALQEENQKLKTEKMKLEAKLMQLQMQKDDQSLQDQVESLVQEASELTEKLAAAEAERDAAEQAYLELAAEKAKAAAELAEEPAYTKIATEDTPVMEAEPVPGDSCSSELVAYQRAEAAELAAYRRAEAAERNAVQRANRIYFQVSELCDSARSRYLESGDEIAALTADLSSGLSRLQETFADIQLIFDEAENAFDNLELPEITD